MFQKITIIDDCGLTEPILEKLPAFSIKPITIFNDFPETDEEIIRRIADSDCVLVSWRTKITAEILKAAPSLKYIGMCCSLYDEKSANVDIAAARKFGIEVRGVRDYGDEGTVEFIFAQLIYLFKGMGKYKWSPSTTELKNKTMGIIGMGTLGKMVARTALHFGMKVFYFSRNRKYDMEDEGVNYLSLDDLLETCDVVSIHLPKNTVLLGEKEFRRKKKNSILVNTSLGLPFEKDAFVNWLVEDQTSFAIFDTGGVGTFLEEFQQLENVIIYEQYAGFTVEAKERLSEKVLEKLAAFLVKE